MEWAKKAVAAEKVWECVSPEVKGMKRRLLLLSADDSNGGTIFFILEGLGANSLCKVSMMLH